NRIDTLLRAAPDPGGCATQLETVTATADDVREKCGSTLHVVLDTTAYAALRRSAAAAREEADARYWGMDLRFDTGDPSFGKIHNAAGTSVAGGLGFGRRFDPTITGSSG